MTDSKPNLILIGLRASGKSTLGAMLAQSLGLGFVDLDDVTSGLLDASGAGEAIETHGIEAFRDAETRALISVLEQSNQIIALGGGTPTAPGCKEMLGTAQASGSCRVVYLRALPSTLSERLKGTDNTDRPALIGGDAVDEVQALFDQRDECYRRLAETTIHCDLVSQSAILSALIGVHKMRLDS